MCFCVESFIMPQSITQMETRQCLDTISPVCDKRRLQTCRLANWQVNEVNIVVKINALTECVKTSSQQCLPHLPASLQVCSLRLSHTAISPMF